MTRSSERHGDDQEICDNARRALLYV